MPIRHASRHLLQSVHDHLRDQLDVLGWLTPGGFKSRPVTLQTYIPPDGPDSSPPNTIVLTLGDEPDEIPEELGDGLVSVEQVLFVDVWGENQPVSLALADDLKDVLRGRRPGLSRRIPFYDYTQHPRAPLPTVVVETSDVIRLRPDNNDFRRNWMVVKATLTMTWVPA